MALALGVNPTAILNKVLSVKLRNPFKRGDGFVVLDIGSSSIKLAEVFHGSSGPRLGALGVAPLPPTAIQSNEIHEEEVVVDTIKGLLATTGIKSTQVITAVPGPAVIVKKVVLPAQTGPGVQQAVMAESSHLIPDSLENVALDYQVVDWIESGNKMEVLVVAVKRDIINSYTGAIRAAGLDPVVVDVDYFALENMFELNYDTPEGGPVALVNIGARYSSINILKDGRSTFTGDVPIGAAEYTDTLVRQLGVSADDAETLKRGGTAGGVTAADAETVLGSVTDLIVEEIQRALSFFWTAATDEPLGQVVLCGGPARVADLAPKLHERLDCPVEVADPFRRLSVAGSVDRDLVAQAGPALAVTVGLATRRPGDK